MGFSEHQPEPLTAACWNDGVLFRGRFTEKLMKFKKQVTSLAQIVSKGFFFIEIFIIFLLKQVHFQLYGHQILHDGYVSLVSMIVGL